jgi:hypothetical protein
LIYDIEKDFIAKGSYRLFIVKALLDPEVVGVEDVYEWNYACYYIDKEGGYARA